MHKLSKGQKQLETLIATLMLVFAATIEVATQSTDVSFPTAVVVNEIDGRILPRDIGDARLTRHFYIFTGTPGDLVVTVESKNLNGDVDVFATGMRPLAKITLYAGADSSTATKSIYLRRQESLILRVEARSMNDAEGTYRIRFDGAFAPASGEMIAQSENNRLTVPVVSSKQPSGRRVTSVGGTVEADSNEAKTNEVIETKDKESSSSASASVAVAESEPKPSPPVETITTPRPVVVRATRTRPRRPRPGRVRGDSLPRRSAPATKPVPSPTPPIPTISTRLIIETRDGERLEREMSTVRRITVENGQLIIVMKDGKSQKQSMTNVLRMAIEP
ncbi:MAG: hypothetical protein H0T92_05335 [Pyrinomonadaceae bacterium]|nr:hypothetical protein [Pyrinomonadaceae bacterium]